MPTKKQATAVTVPADVTVTDQAAKKEQAENIIKKYTLFGTASGLIPAVGADVAVVTAVQTKMVQDLAKVYGYNLNEQLLQTVITTGVTSLVGRVVAELANIVADSITPLKVFLGGATNAAVAGFLTFELGTIYQVWMEDGKNPADVGVMDIVNHVVAQLQAGKWDPSSFSVQRQLGNFMGLGK